MKGPEDLNEINEIVEALMKLSAPERLANFLMLNEAEINKILLSNYIKNDFMAALEVLERFTRKYPDDKDCQAAIEFVHKNFP